MLYTNFTFCFSFWGTSSSTPTGALPLDPTGRLTSPDSLAMPPRREPLHCKILGMPG